MDDAAGGGSIEAELDALLSALALKDERRTGWQLRGIDDPETVAGHTWGVAYLCLLYADRAGVDPDRALRLAVIHDLGEAETGDVPTRADPTAEQPDPDRTERRERSAIASLLAPFDGDNSDVDIDVDVDVDVEDGDNARDDCDSARDDYDSAATDDDRGSDHNRRLPLRDAWEEYEARTSPEALFVKDMDLIDMCLQALYYEREGRYDPTVEKPAFEQYDRLDEFFATAEPRLRTEIGRVLYDAIYERYTRAKTTDTDSTGDAAGQ